MPEVIQGLHDPYVGRIVLLSRLMDANATGDAFDAWVYTERIDANAETIEQEAALVATTCGDTWERFITASPAVYYFMWEGWLD